MGLLANMKGNSAYAQQGKGNNQQALALYEQAFAQGMDSARPLLGYAILLIREEQYEKAVEVLRRAEKAKDLSKDSRNQLMIHYSVAIWKMGKRERAMEILQDLYRQGPNGYLYGTMGYLMVEKGDPDEALRFNKEAVQYDDDDAIFLDNLGQTYYRLFNDKAAAKPYFDKALERKPTAIDTNYFLALYDIEAGRKEEALEKLETAQKGRFSPLNYATKAMVQEQIDQLRGGAREGAEA